MSNLMRFDPIRDSLTVRDMMDRLFDEFYSRPLTAFGEASAFAVDMLQTEDAVVVKASLPGVKPEDIQISVTGDVLSIRGEVKEEKQEKGASYQLRERSYGSFSRSFSLPAPVVSDQAKAEFEHGVLTLTLPKAEEVRPKTISIRAK